MIRIFLRKTGWAFFVILVLSGCAVFISGYTGDIIDRQRISADGTNFLLKPIMPEKLLTLVREVLDK